MQANPRKTTLTLLMATLCGAVYLDYWEYSRSFYSTPGIWLDVISGTADAPAQYRVGVIRAAYWMSQHLHMGMRHAFTLLDFICIAVSGILLYGLLERSDFYRNATVAAKWFGSAAFIVLLQYYLAWLLWYQRPETLPSTMLVVLMLWLWSRKGGQLKPNAAALWLTAIAIIFISGLQGLVRADVSFMLNLGIFLLCLSPLGKGFSLPKSVAILTSLAATVLAGAVQIYMMKVVYPHATYGTTPPFQLVRNIIELRRWTPFLLFVIPYVWTAWQVAKRKFFKDAAEMGVLVGSVMYLAIWISAGMIDEVRIFMPYTIALVPLAVQIAMMRLEPFANSNQTAAEFD